MLIVQMLVGKDESERYLGRVLKSASLYADKILCLGDFVDEKTKEICESFEKVQFKDSGFGKSMFGEDESQLRDLQWEITRKYVKESGKENSWICSLDT